MVMCKGLGALEIYLDAEEGVAFQTNFGMYWTSCKDESGLTSEPEDVECFMMVAQDIQTRYSKFRVTQLPSGKILLRDCHDRYLTYAFEPEGCFIVAEKFEPDGTCEFEPYFEEDKVALKAANGSFVCHVHGRRRRLNFIEASKPTLEECCSLQPFTGDLYPPSHDIIDVVPGDKSHVECQPRVVKKDTYFNTSSEPQTHTFNLAWEVQATEITTWARLWGLQSTTFHAFALQGMGATVTYNGSYLKDMSTRKNISERRSSTVTVSPRSKAIARLVVTKQDQVQVPFTATIRKMNALGESMMEEKGSWKGLVYSDVTLETQEEPIRDESCAAV